MKNTIATHARMRTEDAGVLYDTLMLKAQAVDMTTRELAALIITMSSMGIPVTQIQDSLESFFKALVNKKLNFEKRNLFMLPNARALWVVGLLELQLFNDEYRRTLESI